MTDKESLDVAKHDYVVLFKLSLRTPISSGPKNGEQPTEPVPLRIVAGLGKVQLADEPAAAGPRTLEVPEHRVDTLD